MIIIALLYKNTIPFFSFSVFLFINIVFAIAQKNKRQTKNRFQRTCFLLNHAFVFRISIHVKGLHLFSCHHLYNFCQYDAQRHHNKHHTHGISASLFLFRFLITRSIEHHHAAKTHQSIAANLNPAINGLPIGRTGRKADNHRQHCKYQCHSIKLLPFRLQFPAALLCRRLFSFFVGFRSTGFFSVVVSFTGLFCFFFAM